MEEYQKLHARVREMSDLAFPPGSRVCPIGVTTGNWGGTVWELDEYMRRTMAADVVFVHWDNGNKYAVPIDDIELRHGKR